MINLVSMAEKRLATRSASLRPISHRGVLGQEELALAKLRKAASLLFGAAVLVQWDKSDTAREFAALENADELIQRGPLTPDHSIHTKPFGAVFREICPLILLSLLSSIAPISTRIVFPNTRFSTWCRVLGSG